MRKGLISTGFIVIAILSFNCATNSTRYKKAIELLKTREEKGKSNYVIAFDKDRMREVVKLERRYSTSHFIIYYTLGNSTHFSFYKREDVNDNGHPDIVEKIGEILEYSYNELIKEFGLEDILKERFTINICNYYNREGIPTNVITDKIGVCERDLSNINNPGNIALMLNKYALFDRKKLKGILFHELVHVFQIFYVGSCDTKSSIAEKTADLIGEMLEEGYSPSGSTMKLIESLWEIK